jgi:hypothetical protein
MKEIKDRVVLQEKKLGRVLAIGLLKVVDRLLFAFRLRISECQS